MQRSRGCWLTGEGIDSSKQEKQIGGMHHDRLCFLIDPLPHALCCCLMLSPPSLMHCYLLLPPPPPHALFSVSAPPLMHHAAVCCCCPPPLCAVLLVAVSQELLDEVDAARVDGVFCGSPQDTVPHGQALCSDLLQACYGRVGLDPKTQHPTASTAVSGGLLLKE